MSRLRALIADRIRTTGPISVAEFMRLSLYHPDYGYYARASRRSGRAGDFFTSVDVGPVFGELLARQFAEMAEIIDSPQYPTASLSARGAPPPLGVPSAAAALGAPLAAAPRLRSSQQPQALPESQIPTPKSPPGPFDLVEAGASSGRLARDVLDAVARHHPELYHRVRLHLVEVAPAARAAQMETLGPHAPKLVLSSHSLPERITGVIFANELLDALPTHAVVMREDGLREVFVDLKDADGGDAELVELEREPSTPELPRYLAAVGAHLEPGWRAEINLEAPDWIRRAARSLQRGFLMLIDYGHEAAELYSATHSAGTLTTFQRQTFGDRASSLQDPGEHDITAHVDLTTVAHAAESAGLVTLGRLDQTYFLLGLGSAEIVDGEAGRTIDPTVLRRRLALKMLMLPGGLGSTQKVLIFGKDVGRPTLKGLSYKIRLT
jgi:SAM-dependent MidA family methyltransferase